MFLCCDDVDDPECQTFFLDLLKFRNLKKIFVNTLKDFIGEF